ncbi:uncharacterized protein DFL_008246 [Arthrobotrys flagrans]|uniref:Uncharacterized protein n=1 Tax=Arthrobotrys flagrans TaxID=97331 RepID=A0A436ZN64_ARTFL|nr:hypothetical protein DFL_008246 [Arthrobotrys flagrans]
MSSPFSTVRPYFRRITSSQRSHSPPPLDRKPIRTVIKNVLCFPLRGKKKPSGGEEREEDGSEAKLPDLGSIISSEEQTKAPEGDKLPIFPRLRDWTEQQKEEAEKRATEKEEEKEKERKKREGQDGLPTRSVSTPVRASTPISDLPKERRRGGGSLVGICPSPQMIIGELGR